MNYLERYENWRKRVEDEELKEELNHLTDEQVEEAFYCDLTFGTGGLRGILGVGTNRMNIYVVVKASQGLAEYVKERYKEPSIAIGYDTRIHSDVFSKVAAEVFSENGINVYLYKEPLPVPTLSYATRKLHCSAGVMITASHNPSKYNGYKVYGEDGCQITTEAAKQILEKIGQIDPFDVKRRDLEGNELVHYIDDSVLDAFVEEVKKQSFLYGEQIDKNISVVYTPLNGTGLKPVTRVLKELGYSKIITVKEQEEPDGHFPTCPYPNPEVREAMELGMKYAKENGADILIASDPDCDRVGVAIKDKDDYTILSGNQVGVLLFNYICERKIAAGKMPKEPVLIKTIVTTDLANRIADHYGIKTINVLTGYKFIGEQIGILEKEDKLEDFVFSFEESDGYLSGTYVRDKDGVNGSCLVCEMFAYYKTKGVSLKEKLTQIYEKYGYYENTLYSYEFLGSEGLKKMQGIMKTVRETPIKEIGGKKVININDYAKGIDDLPKSDVVKYYFEDGSSAVIRPSGTEPKLKAYISTVSDDEKDSWKTNEKIKSYFDTLFI